MRSDTSRGKIDDKKWRPDSYNIQVPPWCGTSYPKKKKSSLLIGGEHWKSDGTTQDTKKKKKNMATCVRKNRQRRRTRRHQVVWNVKTKAKEQAKMTGKTFRGAKTAGGKKSTGWGHKKFANRSKALEKSKEKRDRGTGCQLVGGKKKESAEQVKTNLEGQMKSFKGWSETLRTTRRWVGCKKERAPWNGKK